jgi:predicted MPP superfamily phosphohydrolase
MEGDLLYQPMALSRRALLKGVIAGAAGAAGIGAYGVLYEPHALSTTLIDAHVRGLPASLDGLRIGMLTDVHRGNWVSADDVRDAVAMLMRRAPDLVVLGGDYVTWGDRRFVGPAAESLEGLSAPHGVFAVLGNHDDDHDMPNALRQRGIQVLRDARTRITIRGEGLELAGIRFWTRRASDIASVIRGARAPVILLAHDPRRVVEAAALRIPLVLSGHTHGGQVVLPVLGAVAAQKFPVAAGLLQRDETTLFVSRGIGTVYVPVRINCPPEVAVVTIHATATSTPA